MRSSLLGSLTAFSQAIPQMATQGQDASEVVRKIAAVIKDRQKGVALEDAIEATFAPQQQVPPAGAPQMVEQPSPAPEGVPAGGAPTAPEAMPAEMPPAEQAPELQSLLSSLSGSGQASASVRTIRRQ
jgi:hypothetical protein